MALGLGEIELESFLNEPLKASVDLLNLDGLHEDQIRIRLATSEDFSRLGVERLYFLTTLKFNVVTDGPGGPRIMITSEKPVLEPYLDLILEARWPTGRLLREYTILVDPPVYTDSPAVVSASERVYEVEGIPAPEEEGGATAAEPHEPVGLFPDGSQQGAGGTSVKTTGTRVDVRDSNLAPGAMPQRTFNANAAAAPTAGARYMISRDDTLWSIANRAKPAGTSVHQEMLEIQRLNPDAFINGNINRIKAGYIIYLPTSDDVTAMDEPAALAEVREQNAAWREGRDAELYAHRGPSLRISADESEDEAAGAATTDGGMAVSASGEVAGEPGSGSGEIGSTPVGAATDTEAQLAAAEEQLETLKRIVSLKDDQIAALQNALADAGVDADIDVEEIAEYEEGAPGEEMTTVEEDVSVVEVEEPLDEAAVQDEFAEPGLALAEEEADTGDMAPEAMEEAPPVAATSEPAPEPPAKPKPKPQAAPESSGGGWTDNLLYIAGALVLGVLAFVFVRRRGRDDDDDEYEYEDTAAPAPAADVFSDVQLKQQRIEVEPPAEETKPAAPAARDNRGYGERKHDEYASDIDASDALAEADIYIAYGRHPQAIELLNNALETEPDNPVYRLKLLEIYTELNDRGAAAAQLEKIHASGDANSIARADALVGGVDRAETPEPPVAATSTPTPGPGLSPNPLMMDGGAEKLESDFTGLEIEDTSPVSAEDDLDLSGDFAGADTDTTDDEELVIADDSNGLSTKLDLARAYLDMGDDEGARQILDEVIAEGSEDLKTEARTLLDRIGS